MKLLRNIFILFFCATLPLVAQEYNLNDKLPVDKNVRVGKLSNGLTYYLRKNNLPKERVELRLAVNAGSILEDDDQQGLAHFTEHMAFNGTKHFAKNDLISYLQSIGVQFGSDLNAYTSFDETVYRLTVPTTDDEVVNKAFLILEDWAHNISFDPQQIDGERGVITEEWRIGRGAGQRLRDKFLPVVFHQSRYAQRLPIGKIDVIKNFKPEVVTRFYHDWYRPDLMAVIVVGDIDLDKYEQLIKARFGSIQNPANERPRTVSPVPDHPSTLYSVSSDKEATQTQFIVYSKKDHKDQITLADYRDDIIEKLYLFILNQRFVAAARSSDPPFILARSSSESITREKDAFVISGQVRENGLENGLKAVLVEMERVKKYGFTQSELVRAKKSVALAYERAYENRDKSESGSYVGELVRNFLEKEPIPGIVFEYEFTKSQLPGITLREINDYDNSFLSDSNRVIVVIGPDKEGITLPTEEKLKNIVAGVTKEKLEPYDDKTAAFVWPGVKPVAGTVVKEEKNSSVDITTLTLSNGVKVLLKPTDFKNNEIFVIGYSKGGHSLYSDSDYFSALYTSVLVNENGIAGLTKTELIKALAGKDVSVTPFLNSTNEGIKGRTSLKDMEILFQLFNLYFTQANIDSTVFRTFITRQKSTLSTILLSPQRYFDNQVIKVLSNNNPRGGGLPQPEDLDKISLKRSVEIFKDRFANAADFTFVVVGAFEADKLKPLLETYIASLPSAPNRENARDLGIRPPKGTVSKAFYKGTDPKSSVNLVFTGDVRFDPKEDFLLQALNDVLTIRFMETLREEKSGVYGVRAGGDLSKYPYENYKEQISFQCAPENVDSLIAAVLNIIEKIKVSGVDDVTLNKVKETKKHGLEVSVKSNTYWEGVLLNEVAYDIQPKTFNEAKAQIDSLTSKELQRVAKKFFSSNYARFVLYPQK